MHKRIHIRKIIFTTMIIAISSVMLLPLFLQIMRSLIPRQELMEKLRLFPNKPSLSNYILLFRQQYVVRWFLNTFYFASSGFICIIPAMMAGFYLAKVNNRFTRIFFKIIVASHFIPVIVVFLPKYILYVNLRIIDNLTALVVIASISSPMVTFFLRQFYLDFPSEILEAVRIDGANEFQKFIKIIYPLSIAPLAVWGMIIFMSRWTDYMTPLVYLISIEKYTFAKGLNDFLYMDAAQVGTGGVGLAMAGATILFAPLFILYITFQRYFVQNIYSGGVKQ